MSNKVLIIKNIEHEGPGILATLLQEKEIEHDIIDLNSGEQIPTPVDYQAMIVLGGPDSANDKTEKMEKELERIKEAIDSRIPYLGICLGLQTLVKVKGGKVIKSPLREIAFRDPENEFFEINLTSIGKMDPLFEGLNNNFKVFHLHGETVELTPQISLIGTGKYCKNQIVKVNENAYGIQCHFELTPAMFKEWCKIDPDLQKIDQKQLIEDFETIKYEYIKTGRILFSNFLKIAGY